MIIYAVDGTYIQLKENLHNDCKRTKNDTSVTCLVTGVYNVSHNFPVGITFENNETSEKKSFSKLFDDFKNKDEKQIYVFDRGYLDFKMLSEINNNKKYFICRIKKNTKQLDNSKDDYIIQNKYFEKLRIIKYIINGNPYYLCTNLFDNFDNETIKAIYHKRWCIEEYFKLLKNITNINKINEKKIENIKKTFICYNIISKLLYLIKNNYENQIAKSKNKTIKKINISNLLSSLYSYDFFINFFYGTLNKKTLDDYFTSIISYAYSRINRTSLRTCKRSNHISYFKSYSINAKKKCK